VVSPVLPRVRALALVEPRDIVPVVPVAVPVSSEILPELDVVPRASPVMTDTLSVLVKRLHWRI